MVHIRRASRFDLPFFFVRPLVQPINTKPRRARKMIASCRGFGYYSIGLIEFSRRRLQQLKQLIQFGR